MTRNTHPAVHNPNVGWDEMSATQPLLFEKNLQIRRLNNVHFNVHNIDGTKTIDSRDDIYKKGGF
ncbi:hypothetical protein EII17_13605 [Clostridiales bacterium COT073_COT-073]|nr:hypothetical protein EII17_13605 [Clostridiales bacterium COT073_COT-073]